MRANSCLPLVLFRVISVLTLAIPPALFAESPFVDTVCCGLTPGGLTWVEGAYFDRTATVQVGGLPAAVLRYQEFYCSMPGCEVGLQIQLPVELAPGPTTLEITSGGMSSGPFPITLSAYAPAFFLAPVFAPVLIERALPTGGFVPSSCSVGQTLQEGELVRTYATGLGATDLAIPTGAAAPAVPLANTVVKPTITLGLQPAEVIESVLAPGLIGVYRVTLRVPPGSGLLSISIGIGGASSEQPLLRISGGELAYRAAAQSIQTVSACKVVAGNAEPLTGDPKNPQTTLGGITVRVRDSQGVERLARLLAAYSNQVDYIVPAGAANGFARVTITSGDGAVSTGTLDIQSVAPRVLTASPPAVVAVRVRDGIQTVEPVFQANSSGEYEPVPIDLGPETDQVYLIVFGTGWRFRNDAGMIFETLPAAKTVAVAAADYAGPQGEFAGIDQMNVRLPRLLAGRGAVYVSLRVDGQRTGFFARLSFK